MAYCYTDCSETSLCIYIYKTNYTTPKSEDGGSKKFSSQSCNRAAKCCRYGEYIKQAA